MTEAHGDSGHGDGHDAGHDTLKGGHGAGHGGVHGGHGGSSSAKSKDTVFIAVVLVIALVAVFVFLNQAAVSENLWLVFLLLVLGFLVWRFQVVVPLSDYERAVISRFGRLNRVGGPGWTFIVPIAESYEPVDLRTQIIDIPKQDVVTKDGVEVKIDAVIYIKVMEDPQSVINSIVKVEDYKRAAELYVISEIRDVGGTLTMRELISNVAELNTRIQAALDRIARGWGVQIEAVEIKDINIPSAVLDAMHEEKAAVQKKLARMEDAEAHRAEIDAVKEAAEHLSDKALSYYYIKALEKMSEGKSTKIVFPMEISKLAAQISGKLGMADAPEPGAEAQLISKYAPVLAAALKKEAGRRSKTGKAGGKKKAKK